MDNFLNNENDLRRMEMLRASLPYIPVSMQKFLNIYIGFEELMRAIQTIKSAAYTNHFYGEDTSFKTDELMKILRKFCTPKENEMIEMVLNMTKTMSMYDNYKDLFNMFNLNPENNSATDFGKNNGTEKKTAKSTPPSPFGSSDASMDPMAMINAMKSFKGNKEIDDLFKGFNDN